MAQQNNQNQNQTQQNQNQSGQQNRTGQNKGLGTGNKSGMGSGQKMSSSLESDTQADGIPGSDRDIQGKPVEVYVGHNRSSSDIESTDSEGADSETGEESYYQGSSRFTDSDLDFDSANPRE